MGYVLLVGAICCEVFATSMMKAVEGFTVLLPSVGCVVGYLLCFWLLGKALVTVNLSVGYAIWAALGIVLTSIIAVVMFGEQLNVPQSWVSRSLLPVWCWSTCSDRRTSCCVPIGCLRRRCDMGGRPPHAVRTLPQYSVR